MVLPAVPVRLTTSGNPALGSAMKSTCVPPPGDTPIFGVLVAMNSEATLATVAQAPIAAPRPAPPARAARPPATAVPRAADPVIAPTVAPMAPMALPIATKAATA
ncbi:MAG TPA: hypothetical protein VGR74_17340, partial [Actinomycetota bacterium]|nr:hypothetical protein [Actinomycetota bacterium]